MFRKNDLFLARIQIYRQVRLKIIAIITSRVLLIFLEISGNIKFPENLQPYSSQPITWLVLVNHIYLQPSTGNKTTA